jgi:chromosome segregation ATPase
MANTAGPARESGLEPRVARLESDVSEIKSILNRLAPRIDEMYGFLTAKLPELATKAELIDLRAENRTQIADLRTETKTQIAGTKTQIADLRTETKTQIADLRAETKTEFADVRREIAELRLEIMQRPTRRQSIFDIFAVVGLIGAILTVAARFAH